MKNKWEKQLENLKIYTTISAENYKSLKNFITNLLAQEREEAYNLGYADGIETAEEDLPDDFPA